MKDKTDTRPNMAIVAVFEDGIAKAECVTENIISEEQQVKLCQSIFMGALSEVMNFMEIPDLTRMIMDMIYRILLHTDPEKAAVLRQVRQQAASDALKDTYLQHPKN